MVRTWFHITHSLEIGRPHGSALLLAGSTAASALLSGTLKTMVTIDDADEVEQAPASSQNEPGWLQPMIAPAIEHQQTSPVPKSTA